MEMRGKAALAKARKSRAVSENDVSRNTKRMLARAIVEMEINDIVAIEGVRLGRRLKALVEAQRAARRAKRKPVGENR